jgi:hypothetical protein
MSDRRQPWLKWYPADWRADPRLRMCSAAARGVWIDLLGYMHEAEPYGHLVIAGHKPTTQELAALIGLPVPVVAKALEELARREVFSVDSEGRIYSRRMVRDKEKADRDRENGKGGGNPKLRAAGKPENETGGITPPIKPRYQRPEDREKRPETESPGLPVGPSQGATANLPAIRPAEQSTLLDIPDDLDRRRATRLPDVWPLTDELLEIAQRTRIDAGLPAIDVQLEHSKFTDYWHAKSGKDATKRDWPATWRNWIRNARTTESRHGAASRTSGNGYAELIRTGRV